MVRPRIPSLVGVLALAAALAGCSGGSASGGAAATTAPVTAGPPATASTTATTQPAIDGVETFTVEASHTNSPVSYPQVPPVGGPHNPVWQPCGYYDHPLQNEMAVHSLEHGAIWFTYRSDLASTDVDALAALARSRKDILVSPWDDSLPAPLVATAWGRQLRLQSAGDPRLAQFVQAYADKGPEPNAPC